MNKNIADIPYPIFAKRIQQVRDEYGWNLSDIARRAMVTPQAVQQWAKGETAPRGDRLKRLSVATGKPEHWFFMPPDEAKSAAGTIDTMSLDEKEVALLSLFGQLSDTDKQRLVLHAMTMLHKIDFLTVDSLITTEAPKK